MTPINFDELYEAVHDGCTPDNCHQTNELQNLCTQFGVSNTLRGITHDTIKDTMPDEMLLFMAALTRDKELIFKFVDWIHIATVNAAANAFLCGRLHMQRGIETKTLEELYGK